MACPNVDYLAVEKRKTGMLFDYNYLNLDK